MVQVRRALAVVGDAADIGAWSGIPCHFFEEGRRQGFLDQPLELDAGALRWMRSGWHLANVVRGRRPRGFQYSEYFQRAMYRQFERQINGSAVEVVSHWPLFPVDALARERGIAYSFYIDSPLRALFETQVSSRTLDRATVDSAISRERELYHGAARIVGMARWVNAYLRQEYGLPAERLYTVLPGANLPEAYVQEYLLRTGPRSVPARFTKERPFIAGFTGKDWRRKGLERLLKAAELLDRRGYPLRVVVMGHLPGAFRRHRLVRWAGFVDKRTEAVHFVETLGRYDLGCFPSHQEPMGIAPLECLRLGIPVLCTAVGGLVDACPAEEGAGILAAADASGEDLADRIEPLIREPEGLQRMCDAAWTIKERYTWARAVGEMKRIWGEAA